MWDMPQGNYADEQVRSVRFEHVSYRYPNAETDAVHDVSFTVNNSDSVAFVGDSGSGKTTLMMLAMGFLAPTAGEIYVNDVPLREWQLVAYQNRLSAVLQTPYTFQGTVLENVAFKTELSSAETMRATQLAEQMGLAHLLRTTKDGLNTIIGQGGQALSGGQRALLLVSRALYREADMLFFDEMTDNLDLESERALVRVLDVLLQGRTSWIIAHRLQTLRKVDRIYVLRGGCLVKEGRYDEIVDASGHIKEMAVRDDG